jgi:protein-tyrosine phosphatase
MAEAVFANVVQQAGLSEQIQVDSAGTGDYHVGDPADSRTLAVLRKHHIPYNGRARQVTIRDFGEFDYILAMDEQNYQHLVYLAEKHRQAHPTAPQAHLALFLSYAQALQTVKRADVPDPYYNNKFDEVYTLVSAGSQALLQHIREQQGL